MVNERQQFDNIMDYAAMNDPKWESRVARLQRRLDRQSRHPKAYRRAEAVGMTILSLGALVGGIAGVWWFLHRAFSGLATTAVGMAVIG